MKKMRSLLLPFMLLLALLSACSRETPIDRNPVEATPTPPVTSVPAVEVHTSPVYEAEKQTSDGNKAEEQTNNDNGLEEQSSINDDIGEYIDTNLPFPVYSDDIYTYIEAVIEFLVAGIPKNDIDRVFGMNPFRVSQADGAGYSYRYELLKDADYIYENDLGLDTLDMGAMIEGRLRVVVFITYDDSYGLAGSTLYFLGDGGVYEVRDGVSNLILEL